MKRLNDATVTGSTASSLWEFRRLPAIALSVWAACAPAGCSRAPRETQTAPLTQLPALPTPPAPVTLPPPAANPCFNNQYQFTCAIPQGFVITEEGAGPGTIMTLAPRSVRSDVTANLTVQAHRIGKGNLGRYMETNVVEVLKSTQSTRGVLRVEQSTTTYGAQEGLEILVERQYASGPFKSRIFGFVQSPDVFIVDYSAPVDFFNRNPDVVKQFVESLSF